MNPNDPQDPLISLLIADITDAFWLVPLHPSERRYFIAKHRGRWLIFLRTAQGSRGAPLSWACIAALVSRCIQGLYHTPHGEESRLQTYVDDPILAIKGLKSRQARLAVRFCVALLLLGLNVAFNKAQLAHKVVWIGISFRVHRTLVEASIPEDKLMDIRAIITDVQRHNVISIKALRQLSGKCMNVASLLHVWRPFLHQFWAALSHIEGNAPTKCIWTKQIRHTLQWLFDFIAGNSGTAVRLFHHHTYFGDATRVTITTDASPWGLGGTLSISGKLVAYFLSPITTTDCATLERERGSCKSQQAFEALALLVALRLWLPHIRCTRSVLALRTDNVGALTVMSSLKGKGNALSLIAREAALDLANCSYFPQIIEHIPGISNVVPDSLSRKDDPSHQPWHLPWQCHHAREEAVPQRTRLWWRTLSREASFAPG